jgi:hypothetical protein
MTGGSNATGRAGSHPKAYLSLSSLVLLHVSRNLLVERLRRAGEKCDPDAGIFGRHTINWFSSHPLSTRECHADMKIIREKKEMQE